MPSPPERHPWHAWHRWPDIAAGALLFLATAAFVLWQNSQIAILWDLSYLLDTSWRIALGQTPYRDFPLVHPPLTFLIQALLMRLAGRAYLLQILYAATVGGLGTLLAWRIFLRALTGKLPSAWPLSLLLAAPLTVLGIYSIYPHPIYDCDCAVAILLALFLLHRLHPAPSSPAQPSPAQPSPARPSPTRPKTASSRWLRPAATGAALVLPLFFKQNMGLPFLLAVVAGILILLLVNHRKASKSLLSEPAPTHPTQSDLLKLLAAIALTLLAAATTLHFTVGLGNYLHWTVHFAASRRLPGFADMLAVYQQPAFLWTLPCATAGLLLLSLPRFLPRLTHRWIQIPALCLLAAPLLGSLLYLVLNDDLDERADNLLSLWPLLLLLSAAVSLAALRKGITLARLFPFFVLAAIHGTFLSQQLWGSTYAIWPLLLILIACMLAELPNDALPNQALRLFPAFAPTLASIVSTTFLLCGALYAANHERMNYLQIPDDQPLYRTALPPLRGMADRGPYLPDFEELLRFAATEIPPRDALLLLPGEDPFYFATGRAPQFPVLLFDRTTDPYSPAELLQIAHDRNIRWVILKTRLQSNEDPLPDRDRLLRSIRQQYPLYRTLSGYEIYRRPPGSLPARLPDRLPARPPDNPPNNPPRHP